MQKYDFTLYVYYILRTIILMYEGQKKGQQFKLRWGTESVYQARVDALYADFMHTVNIHCHYRVGSARTP